VKTSGAKGLHIFVPIDHELSVEDSAAALRALAARVEQLDPTIATTAFIKADRGDKVFVDSTRAGNATIVAAYSPRARPGVPVSTPIPWEELDAVTPDDFTIRHALAHLGDRDPWAALMPAPQRVPADLVDEGRAIPTPRVLAMHEGKRRARASKPAAD
jgi:bifunctional non-homologous end joining protein LigD